MNAWMTSDLNYQYLTIGITARQEEWRLIGNVIFQGEGLIETTWRENDTEMCIHSSVIEENLKYLQIQVNDSCESTEFMISTNNSTLTIQGSRESLSMLKDLADDFGRNDASDQHVHLSYLENSNYNWFSNKNVELILAVKSDS
jgi:hypothetical protein